MKRQDAFEKENLSKETSDKKGKKGYHDMHMVAV